MDTAQISQVAIEKTLEQDGDGKQRYPIPIKRNLAIWVAQLAFLIALFNLCAKADSWVWIAAIAVAYGIVMNSAYSTIHEAEHNMFHSNPILNTTAGVTLALFFPAPYHLLRQGHLGHHARNRSDDEAFDLYFEGDNVLWRNIYWYGILTGIYWLVVALSNFLVLIVPALFDKSKARFCRPTDAIIQSLNPKYFGAIQLEAAAAIALHVFLIWYFSIPVLNHFLMLYGFGFMWSAMQYVHHFDTVRDVKHGSRNLKTWKWLDLIWLNHNYHLNHHARPTIPWVYLPAVNAAQDSRRGSLVLAYLRMWRGPQLSAEHVENKFAGKIVR